MTVCNMSIEGGARAGMVAPDETTFAYLEGRPTRPQGKAFERAVDALARAADRRRRALRPHGGLRRAPSWRPFVTWGTNPGMVVPVTGRVPDPAASPTRATAGRPSGPWSTWA